MDPHVLAFALFGVGTLCLVLVAFQRRPLSSETLLSTHLRNDVLSIATVDVRGKLTGIRWISEMMLDGEYGDLTIAQIEFVHQLNNATCTAIGYVGVMIDALESDVRNNEQLQECCGTPLHMTFRRVRNIQE